MEEKTKPEPKPGPTKTLTAKDILGSADAAVVPVEAPEWGGIVYLRVLSAGERDHFEAGQVRWERDKRGVNRQIVVAENIFNRARLLVRCYCDADGKRLFGDNQAEELAKKNAAVINRHYRRAREINGLDDEALEEALKNSESIPADGSTSA
ncbi:MAG TPA: hypothetical protein DCQ64_27330 [Candidatus Rokubacteria bacterium]|nr:hypothetical protein [Candidatus Rokubacteria bacterium]